MNGNVAQQTANAALPEGADPSRRVLVAEDSAVYRMLIESALSGSYEILCVKTGEDAWRSLQEPGGPRLLILDWMLPDMEGIELCARLRRSTTGEYFYVVLLTARKAEADLLTAMDAGADDFVSKPFSAAELLARVKAGSRILHLHQQLLKAATCDALTGIPNRAATFSVLANEIDRSRRESRPLALMLADVDMFKSINDTFGHLAGDDVLREIAARLTRTLRTYDTIGRYGGEEFLIVLPGISPESALRRAQNVCEAIGGKPVSSSAAQVSVTLSLGLAVMSPNEPCSVEEIIRRADAALYRAKALGRNRVELSE